MRLLRTTLGGAVLGLLACAGARAQSTADAVYHLHGSVVNAATGRPVGRALVVSQDRRLATMTNAEGRFSLDVSVPAAFLARTQAGAGSSGSVSGSVVRTGGFSGSMSQSGSTVALTAQRPGFLQSTFGTNVALDGSVETRDVVLRLWPAASISGQVTVSGMEGLRGLAVQLLRRSVLDGRLSWQMAEVRPVAENGSFHIRDLQPGEYTVVTREWGQSGLNGPAPDGVSQQYPPDFLGDARTLDGATKLQLRYGQSAQANLHLRAVPYYAVTVPVQGVPPNAAANVRVSTGSGFQLYQLGWNLRDGAVEGALPDGDYVLTVSVAGAQHAAVEVPLHVAGTAVSHAPVGLVPTQDIPVHVRDERTQATTGGTATISMTGDGMGPSQVSNPGFFLMLRPEELDAGGGGMMQNTANGPVLQNLMPGHYYVQGNAMQGYIASMTSDGVDLLNHALVVNDSGHTAPVELTLRDDTGTLSGTVDLQSSGLSAARVLILPTDGSGHVLYSYVTGAGTFQMSNVPPGSYRVFATPADQAGSLPYLDAQAMRPYDGKGGSVSVAAGQTAQVQVDLVGLDGLP